MKLHIGFFILFVSITITNAADSPVDSPMLANSLSSSQIDASRDVLLISIIDSLQQNKLKPIPRPTIDTIRFFHYGTRASMEYNQMCSFFKDAKESLAALTLISLKGSAVNEKFFFDNLPIKNDWDKVENKKVYALFELHQFIHSQQTSPEHKILFQKLSKDDPSFNEIKKAYEDTVGKSFEQKLPNFDERYNAFWQKHSTAPKPNDAASSSMCPDACNTL